jgi:hypothetical protein
MITQGATPVILITVDGCDLSNADEIVVTAKTRVGIRNFTKERISVAYEGSDSMLAIHLTQSESLTMHPKNALFQVRWRNPDGESYTSSIAKTDVEGSIYKGVI